MANNTIKDDILIGTVLAGRYKILERLGSGSMGTVYLAEQTAMHRTVAVKLLKGDAADTQNAVKRFYREMKTAAQIEHPNTIRLYDFGEAKCGQLFLAMEALNGRTLKSVILEEGPMDADRVVRIATQVTKALGAIHASDIVHRDLKPDNIMLVNQYGEEDVVKVLDFGIARFVNDVGTNVSSDGSLVGTPSYMSPEQATGDLVGHLADFYALGCILYHMISGRLPFQADTLVRLLMMHAQEPPPPLVDVAPGRVPPEIEELVMQLLRKQPGERPQTAQEIIATLEGRPHPGGKPVKMAAAVVAGGAAMAMGGSAHASSTSALAEATTIAGSGSVNAALPMAGKAVAGQVAGTMADTALVGATATSTTLTVAGGVAATTGLVKAAVIAVPLLVAGVGGYVATQSPGPESGNTPQVAIEAPADSVTETSNGTGVESPSKNRIGVSRAAIENLFNSDDEPLPPESCYTTDPEVAKALQRAAELLDGGKYKSNRPEDQQAGALLKAMESSGANWGEYWVLRARASLNLGAPNEEILMESQEATGLCGEFAVAHKLVGNAMQKAGRYDEALASYKKAISHDPGYGKARFNIGLVHLGQNRPKEAIQEFDELLERDGSHTLGRMLRGQAKLSVAQYADAVQDLEEYTRLEPSKPQGWLLLGQSRSCTDDTEGAIAAYGQAETLGAKEARKAIEVVRAAQKLNKPLKKCKTP